VTGAAPPDPAILVGLATMVSELDATATSVPVQAPWTAATAGAWDTQTLESWLGRQPGFDARTDEVAALATRALFGAEPGEVPLLFALFYIASSGGPGAPGTFARLFDTRGGAQQSRFGGGTQAVALRAAERLGDRVLLSSPVRHIAQRAGSATVTSDRATVTARQVVVAVPPALAARIDYEPVLPFQRDQLTQRCGQGTLAKVACAYDAPFWRGQGTWTAPSARASAPPPRCWQRSELRFGLSCRSDRADPS
jgi:monoamine oxidase